MGERFHGHPLLAKMSHGNVVLLLSFLEKVAFVCETNVEKEEE